MAGGGEHREIQSVSLAALFSPHLWRGQAREKGGWLEKAGFKTELSGNPNSGFCSSVQLPMPQKGGYLENPLFPICFNACREQWKERAVQRGALGAWVLSAGLSCWHVSYLHISVALSLWLHVTREQFGRRGGLFSVLLPSRICGESPGIR